MYFDIKRLESLCRGMLPLENLQQGVLVGRMLPNYIQVKFKTSLEQKNLHIALLNL